MAPWEEQDLGVPADLAPPVVGKGSAVATLFRGTHSPSCDQSPVSVGNTPADEDMLLEECKAIVVGAVGTGAPWFLTGWAEGTEVEFMIYTVCQVTILATSVFERMCAADQLFGSRLRPCRRRLVSADSSPLMVRGELDMFFWVYSVTWRWQLLASVLKDCWGWRPCNNVCLISSISVRVNCGLRDTTIASTTSAHIKGSLVMPPDSEIVAPVSIRSLAGIPLGQCSLIEPDLIITDNYGVLVGRNLVDASDWSANILLINPGSDTVVLPSFSYVGDLVPVSAVSVAQAVVVAPETNRPLPQHPDDIVTGSHPSLGMRDKSHSRIILH